MTAGDKEVRDEIDKQYGDVAVGRVARADGCDAAVAFELPWRGRGNAGAGDLGRGADFGGEVGEK